MESASSENVTINDSFYAIERQIVLVDKLTTEYRVYKLIDHRLICNCWFRLAFISRYYTSQSDHFCEHSCCRAAIYLVNCFCTYTRSMYRFSSTGNNFSTSSGSPRSFMLFKKLTTTKSPYVIPDGTR